MPNQLSATKKRKTVAEHAMVLAALEQVAAAEGTTSTELLRQAAREVVRSRLRDARLGKSLRKLLRQNAPQAPKVFKSAKQAARFKARLREYDALCLDLDVQTKTEIQTRNSVHAIDQRPSLVGRL